MNKILPTTLIVLGLFFAATPSAGAREVILTRGDDVVSCQDPSYANFPLQNAVMVSRANADQVICSVTSIVQIVGDRQCDLLGLVCADAHASAYAYNCYDADINQIFPCWYGYGGGSASGALGAVTGTLAGYANGVPLSDVCYTTNVGTWDVCALNAYADRYPGTVVQVSVTVSATAPYGYAEDTDVAFDS